MNFAEFADVVRLFGEEIILIWAAMMMKKRIAVFSDKLGALMKLIRYLWNKKKTKKKNTQKAQKSQKSKKHNPIKNK